VWQNFAAEREPSAEWVLEWVSEGEVEEDRERAQEEERMQAAGDEELISKVRLPYISVPITWLRKRVTFFRQRRGFRKRVRPYGALLKQKSMYAEGHRERDWAKGRVWSL
jgi:hypothetical protein